VVPDRPITLNYASTCRRCGRPLDKAVRALWDPATHTIACVRCPDMAQARDTGTSQPTGQDRSRPAAATRMATPSASGDPQWARLLDYHRACTERSAQADAVRLTDRTQWALIPLEREEVTVGSGDALPVGPELAALFRSKTPDQDVFYGWPMVVVQDRTRTLRVAPLVLVALEPPKAAEERVMARHDPLLNPALLRDDFFPPEAIAEAQAAVAEGLAYADPEGLCEQVQEVLDALGLECDQLDPLRLDNRRAPRSVGAYNRAIAYRGSSAGATHTLIDELEALRARDDWRETAAGFLVDGVPARPEVRPRSPVAPLALNDSQEQALTATATAPVTVVTGPPGTGKSQLVAAIVAAAWLRGERVLVASTNNGAVDVAVKRAAEIDEGLLIRTGNQRVRDALPPLLETLTRRERPAPGVATAARRELDAAIATRVALHARIERQSALEGELATLAIELERLRMELWQDPGPSPVHAQRQLLAERARRAVHARFLGGWRRGRVCTAAQVARGTSVARLAEWADVEQRWDTVRAELTTLGPLDGEAARTYLAAADARWAETSRKAVHGAVGDSLGTGSAALSILRQVVHGGTRERVRAVTGCLGSAKGWACTALSTATNFPLVAGLFDLVVIDEASQCGIAEVLPLAYRAKRIVLLGDPKQLTPVVTLNERTVRGLATDAGTTQDVMRDLRLSYGHDSAFTAFDHRTPGQPFLLDEHYRCHPVIAAYVNDTFYDGSLRVLTDVTAHEGDVRGLHWLSVRGHTEPGPHSGAVNAAEVAAVERWVLDHADGPGSLGVVTPFALQATTIEKRLRKALGEETWAARDIVVGTAHRFQGGERDVVLFSPVLASGANPGTARWVEQQRNLVNVAVSRARRALIVLGDDEVIATLGVPTLAALAAAARKPRSPEAPDVSENPDLASTAERRLYLALTGIGLRPELKPVVDGYELDFAIRTEDGRCLDIECDGTQHVDSRGRQRRQDLVRDHVLGRLGWTVLRYPAWRCLSEPDLVAEDVRAHLIDPPPAVAEPPTTGLAGPVRSAGRADAGRRTRAG
jgi:very-short-patch-repair endonuclease